ncbi:hypothetical protein QPK13_22315 [Photorhabdus tasmaniensis]
MNYAKQTQSALQTTISAVRIAQKMKDNPAVALTRVPGLLTGLNNIAGPLGKSYPAFQSLGDSLPDAIQLTRATGQAVTFVNNAQSSLSRADSRNIAAALDSVSAQLESASSTFTSISPVLSKMAAQITTRTL